MDLTKLSTEDLKALRDGDLSRVSTTGLQSLRGSAVPELVPEPVSVRAGRGLAEIPRQAGLGARYALEGLPALADVVWEPARRLAINPALRAVGGPELGSMQEAGRGLADLVGLPKPEGSDERVIGDAAKLGFSAIGGAGIGSAVASAPGLLGAAGRMFANAPGMQALSATGAGLAGGSVREAGGNDAAQFTAALAGGLLAPMAANKVAGALTSARSKISPQMVENTVKIELGKVGIDWDTLGQNVRAEMLKDASEALKSGGELNAEALGRLAQYRAIGATPLLGDVTLDPKAVTMQRNLAKQQANMPSTLGAPDLSMVQNANAKSVLGVLDDTAKSPLDTFATGEGLLGKIQARDAAMAATERSLYGAARDAAGREIPLARGAFLQDVEKRIADTNTGFALPESVKSFLNSLANPKTPFNVNTIDAYKRVLGNEIGKAQRGGDGNAVMAIKAIRSALDDVSPEPIKRAFGGNQVVTERGADFLRAQDATAAEALKKFDTARAFAKGRRQWQESSKFIEDAIDGGIAPDAFVKKHIIGAQPKDLQAMRDMLSARSASREVGPAGPAGVAGETGPDLVEAVRRQMLDYIKQRGGADSGLTTFGSKGMEDGLKAIGDRRLSVFFSPEEITKIKASIGVARSMQAQPIGSAVNNSNSAATLLGRGASMLGGANLPILSPIAQTGLLRYQTRQIQNLPQGLLSQASGRTGAFDPKTLAPAAVYSGLLAMPSE